MSTVHNARKIGQAALLAVAITAAFAASALGVVTPTPRVITQGVKHVHGSSGQLDAVVNPNGVETSYFFEYGPTPAYGKSTKPEQAGKGTKGLKIGQPVTGLLAGYHYRVVATFIGAKGTLERVSGKDKSFAGGKSAKLRFSIAKGRESEESTVAYGGTTALTGALTGVGNTGHGLILQATPYPYTGLFTQLGQPILTNLTGRFTFRVADMRQNTEFRILTTDRRPIYSSIITIRVTPKIILHIRAVRGKGRYRVYGTVAPARLRGLVAIQELKPQKPNSKREGPVAHTVGSAPIRKGNSRQARFSVVLTLSGTSRYRVYLKLPPRRNLISGHSNVVLVHAPKLTVTKKRGKHKSKKTKAKHAAKHAGKRRKKK